MVGAGLVRWMPKSKGEVLRSHVYTLEKAIVLVCAAEPLSFRAKHHYCLQSEVKSGEVVPKAFLSPTGASGASTPSRPARESPPVHGQDRTVS